MPRAFLVLLLVAAMAVLSACQENAGKEAGRALLKPVEKSRNVAAGANLDALIRSIAAFHASNGEYPADLEELAGAMGLDPGDFDYDPETGRVSLR